MFTMISLITIILILHMISNFMKPLNKKNREKISIFECGFEPEHKMRSTFSLRFFLITVIFLIFDLEIIMIMPLPLSMFFNFSSMSIITNVIIFILISSTLLLEWSQKSLNWA